MPTPKTPEIAKDLTYTLQISYKGQLLAEESLAVNAELLDDKYDRGTTRAMEMTHKIGFVANLAIKRAVTNFKSLVANEPFEAKKVVAPVEQELPAPIKKM